MDDQPDHWLAPSWREHLWREYRRGTGNPVRPAGWLYPLVGNLADFRSGRCPGGEQVLIGQYFPCVVACFFSPAGQLLRVEERPLAAAPRGPDPERDAMYLEVMRRDPGGPEFDPQLALEAVLWLGPTRDGERLALSWMGELAVRPGPVRVLRFRLPDRRIGVEDGNRLDEAGLWEDSEGSFEAWLAAGQFVFWWSRDLWVDGEGKVFAT
jgi:hypothetical protein